MTIRYEPDGRCASRERLITGLVRACLSRYHGTHWLMVLFLGLPTISIMGEELAWLPFDLSSASTLDVGTVCIRRAKQSTAMAFPEDSLELVLGEDQSLPFNSSYGRGRVSILGNYALLVRGEGRGTACRIEKLAIVDMVRAVIVLEAAVSAYQGEDVPEVVNAVIEARMDGEVLIWAVRWPVVENEGVAPSVSGRVGIEQVRDVGGP